MRKQFDLTDNLLLSGYVFYCSWVSSLKNSRHYDSSIFNYEQSITLGDELELQCYVKHLIIWRSEMYKNTLSYGFILTILFIQSDTAFAADQSKIQPEKDKTSIELQRDKSQQLAPKMMGNINLAQLNSCLNFSNKSF